ncbi:MAG: heme ABC transporter ATP-binding protein [Bdellovibrionota bacterium]
MILLKDIQVQKSSRVLLDVPHLRLLGGKVTVILGANGAGKSTLLRVLAGAIKPDQGEVLLFGQRLTEWNTKKLAQSRAMLSQHYSMPFPMSVRELVAMGRFPYLRSRRDETMVDEAMAEMEVSRFAGRSIQTLSGGEQQRAHMARVLLQLKSEDEDAPRLLLLDEPVSSLDIVHQRTLLNKARDAARSGYTVVIVLHDINLAGDYADQFLLMKKGKIIAQTHSLDPELLGEVFDTPMLRIADTNHDKHYFFAGAAR